MFVLNLEDLTKKTITCDLSQPPPTPKTTRDDLSQLPSKTSIHTKSNLTKKVAFDTDIYNHVNKNALLDWLELYGIAKGYKTDHSHFEYCKDLDFTQYISEQTRRFKGKCLQYIRLLLSARETQERVVITIPDQVATRFQTMKDEAKATDETTETRVKLACEETRLAIQKQADIIVGPMLYHQTHDLYCKPDFLIKATLLPKLFLVPIELANDNTYVILNALFLHLDFKAENDPSIINLHNAMYHRCKALLQAQALAQLEGFVLPKFVHVIGRSWRTKTKKCMFAFHSPGTIGTDDARVEKTCLRALDWLTRLKKEGASWVCTPQPSVDELYPNMNNRENGKWNHVKKELATSLHELTLLWHLSHKHRSMLHARGITRLDQFPGSGLLPPELKEHKFSDTMAKIHAINYPDAKSTEKHCILPAHAREIKTDMFLWRLQKEIDFYVDFETVSSLGDTFEHFPVCDDTSMITMIGCGHVDPFTLKQEIVVFTVRLLDKDEEKKIIHKWFNHMRKVLLRFHAQTHPHESTSSESSSSSSSYQQTGVDTTKSLKRKTREDTDTKEDEETGEEVAIGTLPCKKKAYEPETYTVWHYTHAEKSFLQNGVECALARHDISHLCDKIIWKDLQLILRAEPIVIQGCFGYSLKSIAKTMNKLGLIDIFWPDSQIDCGLSAMVALFRANEYAKQHNCAMDVFSIVDDVTMYNRSDVSALILLIAYLRSA